MSNTKTKEASRIIGWGMHQILDELANCVPRSE